MGSSDSTCCSSNLNAFKSETDCIALKRNRKSTQFRQYKQCWTTPMGEEGESALISPATNKLITALKLYNKDGLDLNKNCEQQFEELIQSLIDEQTKNNMNINKEDDIEYICNAIKLQINATNITKKQLPKIKIKKPKYGHVSTQIQILYSEGLRSQSLLLCIKKENIKNKDRILKPFGFLPFLRTNLNEEAVEELFNKFCKSNWLSTTQFISLLTLIVIVYKTKLHQLQTDSCNKPEIDSEKIKTSIEHLAIWCIRCYGVKKNKIKTVNITNDFGDEIEGEYDSYKLNFSKYDCTHNLYHWIQEYVDKDGVF